MPKVCFNVVVDSIDDCEVHCSEADFSIDRTNLEDGSNIALVLGLPVAITERELEIFVDPFAAGIEGMCLLHEKKDHSFGQTCLTQHKKMALIFFADREHLTSFKDLYNNMQLPSYSETAPCVVVQLSELTVHAAADLRTSHPADRAKSASTSSAPSPLTKAVGSPGRAFTTKTHAHAPSLLQCGVQILLQHTFGTFSNPHTPRTPSTTHTTTDHAAAVTKPSSSVVSQMVALPTCTVCLRRIRCVSTLAEGLSGANDRMVGRSYTCDAKLSFDELNALSGVDGCIGSGEEVVLKSSGPSSGGDSTGVRCIVCHTYHTVATSRSIGTTSNTSYSALSMRHAVYANNINNTTNATANIPESGAKLTTDTTSLNPASHTTSNTRNTHAIGQCQQCHLSENIWLCLLCGHTGCGRYTSQHAKAHYQHTLHSGAAEGSVNGGAALGANPVATYTHYTSITPTPTSTATPTAYTASHHLSLELASGRIWNYETDTFDYIEDEVSHYTGAAGTAQGPFIPITTDSNSTTSTTTSDGALPLPPPHSAADRASPTACKKFVSPSFLYTGDTSSSSSGVSGGGRYGVGGRGHAGHSELLTPTAAASLGLDATTTDKINALMSHYEHLLEAQLQDQQLYFEKLLARETVRALELSYVGNGASGNGGGGKGMSGKKSSSKKLVRTSSAGESSAVEEKKDDSPPTDTSHTPTHHSLHYNYLTQTPSYYEASTTLQNEEVLAYMSEVEALKLEISTVEAQYKGVLESIKGVDEEVRRVKKSNDALIRGQKAQKEKEIELKARAVELRAQHEETVRDLQQQIQDLSFYTKTRKQVQESPLKDEIKQGTVVTHQRHPTTPGGGTGSGTGGNNSKK